MLRIMEKHGLNQLTLAKILDISQGTVNGWFHRKTNLQGKIKTIYFEMLKHEGYK
jgi:transcriptional regulator with XRE-family HTH domain